jgi:hypothetical protein
MIRFAWTRRTLPLFIALTMVSMGCGDDSKSSTEAGTTAEAGSTTSAKTCVAVCTTASDCPKAASGYTYDCQNSQCKQIWCKASSGCTVAIQPKCIDFTLSQQCLPANCTDDSSCTGTNKCYQVFPGYKGCYPISVECATDSDCTSGSFAPGLTKCQDKYCGCESDSTCQSAKNPLVGGTWKCLSFPKAAWKQL